MFDKFQNRLFLSGDLVLKTALRIGAGRSIEPVGTDLPVVKDASDKPYIPGSSFKGILRSRIEQFIRAQIPGRYGACNPVDENEWCIPSKSIERDGDIIVVGMETLKKKAENEAKKEKSEWYRRQSDYLTKLARQKTCLVCQLFGSPWLASHVLVKDLLVDEKLWFNQYQLRDGVAIDRETETAGERKLYSYEVVPVDTRFLCEIVVENATDWQLGMLMLALLPFERGEIAIGGARSRGLGRVQVHWIERKYFAANGDAEQFIKYLRGEDVSQNIDDKDEEGKSLIDIWIDAFICKLKKLKKKGGQVDA